MKKPLKKSTKAVTEYRPIRHSGKVALVSTTDAIAISDALLHGKGCRDMGAAGRGRIFRFDVGGGTGILRQYRRGGVVRFFMRASYLFVNRPIREFQVHRFLEEQGLAVPTLLGVSWARRGPFVSGAIATGELQGTSLLEWLRDTDDDPEAMLHRCGALTREMHNLHVWHADLQVLNILVTEEGPYLIDFDNARKVSHLGPRQRVRNLLRLRRSFEKHELPPAYFEMFCAGYGMESIPAGLDALYRVRGRFSTWMARGR
jgi:3-deoxy-D-manno-octulosonic acid kinase